jgi:hypothetical protein
MGVPELVRWPLAYLSSVRRLQRLPPEKVSLAAAAALGGATCRRFDPGPAAP